MASSLKRGESPADGAAAAAMKIASGSRTMLDLVEGCPEFERLAALLDRTRSEALRILHLHGLAPPAIPRPRGGPKGREPLDREGSTKA